MDNLRILWVDDEPHRTKVFVNRLENMGHQVVQVSSLTDACRRIFWPGFNIIILDQLMPMGELFEGDSANLVGTAGLTLYKHLRRYDDLDKMPVIIFTNLDQDTEEHWREFGPIVEFHRKTESPLEFAQNVIRFARENPYTSPFFKTSTIEHPNVACYAVQATKTGEWLRCFYEPCMHHEAHEVVSSWDGEMMPFLKEFLM